MNARACNSTHQTPCQRAVSRLADDTGAIGVEYGLLVALIALATAAALVFYGWSPPSA